jgi:hypothetical protein
MEDQLLEIVHRGGRAQAAEAARLLARLSSHPDDAAAQHRAETLVRAYLHDPDLTR